MASKILDLRGKPPEYESIICFQKTSHTIFIFSKMYKPGWDITWSYPCDYTKAASIWEHVQLSLVSSEILGRFISVPIHETEDDCFDSNYIRYRSRPECIYCYSPGLAASFPIIREAKESKFILVN